ncbi:phosphodiesterase [Ralstonia solanacearum]|uniref:phosphodiesterase n=1 Tax=Ralstonia solanacearum TaxID=305 RepID=UPI00078E275D|nr:phosphodiesterase [Ralstonia solanacearum]AMP39403.1 diguanylate cyclase [Ralstonia solanacearum]AXV88239.1 phosphodiesterase [Ralstonia solanacearum]AXW07719.1 phosphodiesterase [Ralstonia solanacearum]AXW25512.1 phosphodiesterase [Ralstonia solanacearum]AXW82424.1 phosphodiesterase [Ralstonia solanacearum]
MTALPSLLALPPGLDPATLRAVFQPIFHLSTSEVLGYEALLRGPAGSAIESPAALFALARDAGNAIALEIAAAQIAIHAFSSLRLPGKLFLNFSAEAMRRLLEARARLLYTIADHDLHPSRIVFELTEQSPIDDLPAFARELSVMRDFGLQCALDDFGTGNANLNLLIELAPDFVKLDKYFVHDIATHPAKLDVARSLQQILKSAATSIIAEGLETEDELSVVRDLGIRFGQGFFLGRPQDQPAGDISARAARVLQSSQIAVFPQAVRIGWRAITASKLLRVAPTLSIRSTNDDMLTLFNRQPDLHAVALLDEHERPLALIARRAFIDRYAMPYHRELYGKKPALVFANRQPVLVEKSASLEDMSALLMSEDQRYLTDGFIITEHGRYLGLGTGEELVRTVTEIRIEAARYANPLTFLPGNIPLNLHIERLLEARAEFIACYVDLNHFKPFNDQYGYWQGDEMLKMAAAVLATACEPTRDFLGHVGGDDFLVLFQSADWRPRIQRAMAAFNDNALAMYTPADRAAAGIHAEDRKGLPAFFRCVTMAVGALLVRPGAARSSDDIGAAAALAKRRAKQNDHGFHFETMPPAGTRTGHSA